MVNRLEHKALQNLVEGWGQVSSWAEENTVPTYSDAFGSAHVISCQSALGGHHTLFVLRLQV
jgi:hypothetical protein